MRGRVAFALALSGLAGCAEIDPLTRPGVWRPTGANEANLRAMVAVPGDLAQGYGAAYGDGHRAARAVERLRTDRVYPLPDNGISKVGKSDGPAAPQPGQAE